ncbi:unnamed protein product [Bursaphelenchus okinawaensis]|uniref:Uncharacterized protein n=1 Tax=Bursaphelenchus okinawaensis TaxID=465554 RepID=A0A811KD61_9BILA|nr:unnamed protein product [Bursaphelenchus okinawaensis]CAG9097697.1 unnamed protein product [Bursaphelenchus okinawaensis]
MSSNKSYTIRIASDLTNLAPIKFPWSDERIDQAVEEARCAVRSLRQTRQILTAATKTSRRRRVNVAKLHPLFMVEEKKRPEKKPLKAVKNVPLNSMENTSQPAIKTAKKPDSEPTVKKPEFDFDKVDLEEIDVPYSTFTSCKLVDDLLIEDADDWAEENAIIKKMMQEDTDCLLMPPPSKRPKRCFINAAENKEICYDLADVFQEVSSELEEADENFEVKKGMEKLEICKKRLEWLYSKWDLPMPKGSNQT